jgi:glycosyltransferase involved in cell wall biosynthesis
VSSQRIKVLYFIPSLVQGGSERQILELIRQLPPHYEPILCLYEDAIHYRRLLPEGQPRYILGTKRLDHHAGRRLIEILRRERPQILHSYLDRANFWGRLAGLRAGVPVIISSCRARMIPWRYLVVERALANRCQLVIANSVGVRDELIHLARVPRERVRVIHNFLDLDHFRPPTPRERAAARQRWRIAQDEQVLLFPGRISIQKHQLGLLLALGDLEQRGRLPAGTRLLLAGRGRDAAIDRLVKKIAARPPLNRVVRLLGAHEDIRSLYWAADILVLPSLYEGLPNAALEGAACALPAVLSYAANLDRIVDPGQTGWEFATGDRSQLAFALDQALHASANQLQQMGAGARAHMLRQFSPDRIRDELGTVYDQLLQGTP